MLKSWKFWLALIAIGAFSALVVGYMMYNKPHPDYVSMEAEHIVEASQIYEDFKQSFQEASEKYGGKVIQINGQLNSVESLDTTLVAVFVIEEGIFGDQGIRCTMHPDHLETLQSLNPGSQIEVKGFCAGFNETDVILEKCVIVN